VMTGNNVLSSFGGKPAGNAPDTVIIPFICDSFVQRTMHTRTTIAVRSMEGFCKECRWELQHNQTPHAWIYYPFYLSITCAPGCCTAFNNPARYNMPRSRDPNSSRAMGAINEDGSQPQDRPQWCVSTPTGVLYLERSHEEGGNAGGPRYARANTR
jgi:hypothetical protein